MADALFLLAGDGSLRTMSPAPFQNEDVFQALLERYPALLTASTFGEAEPRRWILVRREMGVADRADASGRWSLDHLFLDQDGVPTLVEIKRATDTRARREVVAQMLDYAANAVSWWRVSELVEHFRSTCAKQSRTSEQALQELLQTEAVDEEAFWRKVQANLTSGRIRLLFVADVIYPELQRIVEFLNEQMNPAVVAAVELRPFSSGADRLISPRVIGETQKAQAIKTLANDAPVLDAAQWLDSAHERWPKARSVAIEQLLERFRSQGFHFETSKGGYHAAADITGRNKWMMTILPSGIVQVNFSNWTRLGRLRSEQGRTAMMQRLNEVPGLTLSTSNISGYPTFNPDRIDAADGWDAFGGAIGDLCTAARDESGAG